MRTFRWFMMPAVLACMVVIPLMHDVNNYWISAQLLLASVFALGLFYAADAGHDAEAERLCVLSAQVSQLKNELLYYENTTPQKEESGEGGTENA